MDVEHPQYTHTNFNIQTDVYSGPLDLLIDLLERRKLLINDISLATVTDDYLMYISRFEEDPLKDVSEFIVLAATLLLLKSKSLLPILELTETEDETIESLEKRLLYYQIFRRGGSIIESTFGKHIAYERKVILDKNPIFLPDRYATPQELSKAIASIVQNLPIKVDVPKVQVKKVVSLENMIMQLRDRIEKELSIKFKDFTKNSGERSTIIIGFLAVLEMVKQGSVLVRQVSHFHDIEIERTHINPPRYH